MLVCRLPRESLCARSVFVRSRVFVLSWYKNLLSHPGDGTENSMTWFVFLLFLHMNTYHCMEQSGTGSYPVHMWQPIHLTAQSNLLWMGNHTSWWTPIKTADQNHIGAANVWESGSLSTLTVQKTKLFIQYPNVGRTVYQPLPYLQQEMDYFRCFIMTSLALKALQGLVSGLLIQEQLLAVHQTSVCLHHCRLMYRLAGYVWQMANMQLSQVLALSNQGYVSN